MNSQEYLNFICEIGKYGNITFLNNNNILTKNDLKTYLHKALTELYFQEFPTNKLELVILVLTEYIFYYDIPAKDLMYDNTHLLSYHPVLAYLGCLIYGYDIFSNVKMYQNNKKTFKSIIQTIDFDKYDFDIFEYIQAYSIMTKTSLPMVNFMIKYRKIMNRIPEILCHYLNDDNYVKCKQSLINFSSDTIYYFTPQELFKFDYYKIKYNFDILKLLYHHIQTLKDKASIYYEMSSVIYDKILKDAFMEAYKPRNDKDGEETYLIWLNSGGNLESISKIIKAYYLNYDIWTQELPEVDSLVEQHPLYLETVNESIIDGLPAKDYYVSDVMYVNNGDINYLITRSDWESIIAKPVNPYTRDRYPKSIIHEIEYRLKKSQEYNLPECEPRQ